MVAGRNLARCEEESFSRTMRVLEVDFLGRPLPLGVEGEALCAPAMVGRVRVRVRVAFGGEVGGEANCGWGGSLYTGLFCCDGWRR